MFTYQDWEDFCNYLIYQNRFILDDKRKAVVEEIIKLSKQGEEVLTQGQVFWRARINNKPAKMVDEALVREQYAPEEMLPPPPELVKDGRANPFGISYLYMSDEMETAIAEVRPHLNATVDLISLRLKKDIKVISFQKPVRRSTLAILNLPKDEINNLWFGMQLSFSVVLSPEDKLNYIPMQYLAELFKNNGYDGVVYESVQRKGHTNLVLFDRTAIELGNMDERTIYEIEYVDNVGYAKKKIEEGAARLRRL